MEETIKVRKQNKNNTPSSSTAMRMLIPFLLLLIAGACFLGLSRFKGYSNNLDSVDETKLQAVYLKGGQIFFGNITEINREFVELENVYYLQVDGSGDGTNTTESEGSNDQGSAISLTKRGCEIYAPEDKMFISRHEVAYFDNLRTDGDVAKGADAWVNDNPNGLNCG